MSDPVTSILAPYGAVGLLALLAVAVARVLFQKLDSAHSQAMDARADELRRAQEALDRAQARADRLESELTNLNATVRGVYVDTIVRSSQAINDAARAVADVLAVTRRS
jgi:uncharacterized protein YlxW (UPF0749 family)